MFKFRAYQVVLHIAGWLLFMALPLLFINGGQNNVFAMLNKPPYWLFCATYIFLFYFNSFVLFPQLFLKKKYILYALVTLVLLAGTYYLKPYDRLIRSRMSNNSSAAQRSVVRDGLPGSRMSPSGDDGRGRPEGPAAHPGEAPQRFARAGQVGDTCRHPGPPGKPGYPARRFGPNNGEMPHFQPPRHDGFYRPFDIVSFFIFLLIIALSTTMEIMQQWQMTEQRASRAEADKASAELSFLKAQINPHFLFNTLNNIYTLAVMKDDNAPDSIMKLSNIMRYVTDDATEDFVPLQSEVACINDYIELQRLRLGEKTRVDMDISGEIENKKIPPLVLMTFVENVFKYGISKHHPSTIVIKLTGDQTGISFFCQNRIFPEKDKKHRVGIGLNNTKQRLDYLYPGKHILDINTEHQMYTVKLMLQTS